MKVFLKGLRKLFRQFFRGFIKLIRPIKKGSGTQALVRRYTEIAWATTQAWRLRQLLVPGARLAVVNMNLRITVVIRVMDGNVLRMGQWGPGKGSWFMEGQFDKALATLSRLQTNMDSWTASLALADGLRKVATQEETVDKTEILQLMEQ